MQQFNEEKVIDLSQLVTIIKNGKKIIISCGAVLFLAAILFVWMTPPKYQPTALIQVDMKNDIGGSNFSLFDAASAPTQQASPTQVQMALMQTPYILLPVIKSTHMDIAIVPKFFPLFGAYIARNYKGAGLNTPFFGLSGYAWGGENLVVSAFNVPENNLGKKYILKALGDKQFILYDAMGNKLLQGDVGTFVTTIDGLTSIQVKQLHANPGTEFTIQHLSETAILQNLVNQVAIKEMVGLNAPGVSNIDTGIVQVSMQGNNANEMVSIINAIVNQTVNANLVQKSEQNLKTLAFIEQQIPKARQGMLEAESLLAEYQAQNKLVSLDTENQIMVNKLSQIDDQIVQAQLTKDQLSQFYTNQAPALIGLESQLEGLNKERTAIEAQLAQLPSNELQYIDLMRAVKVASNTYMLLINKHQQLELIQAAQISQVHVLTLANIPDAPMPNKAFLIILGSTMLGMFFGLCFIFVREMLNKGIIDPYYPEKQFGIKTVAIVPYSTEQAKNKKQYELGKIPQLPILAIVKPNDPSVESLCGFRTGLELPFMNAKNNIVNIMGVSPTIGKSFVLSNFGVVSAKAGKKVLLVDADMRLGYMNKYFDLPMAPGLAEILRGNVNMDIAIAKTSIPNLDFIPCGMHVTDATELLMKLEIFLDSVKAKYDLILLDTAPILAASDCSVISKYAGLNYIIVGGGVNEAAEVEFAIKKAYQEGIKLDGAIFNFPKEVRLATHMNSYYYSQGKNQNKRRGKKV